MFCCIANYLLENKKERIRFYIYPHFFYFYVLHFFSVFQSAVISLQHKEGPLSFIVTRVC